MNGSCGEIDRQRCSGDAAAPCRLLDWNGRIDNRGDLEAQLRDRLRDRSNNGTLAMAAFRHWGISGLGRIIGDWSLVFHDPASSTTVLASDYAGVRPLYYYVEAGKVHWSARLEPLAAKLRIDTIDEQYVAGLLTMGGSPNLTPWIGIRSVPPGHAVCITSAGVSVQSFWSLPTSDEIRYSDERRYDEQFVALFREAVGVRLQTPAPVVAELSGGLDSSSVVCVASDLIRCGAVPATLLTPISYVYRNSLDTPFIQEVEAWCGLKGVHLSTHQSPLAAQGDATDPVPGDSAALEKAAVATAHGLGAKVFLTGQNGDLAMGNWFDDSLQVAGALRRGHVGQACSDALAWSKVLRIPVMWILWRAGRAMLSSAPAPNEFYTFDGMQASGQMGPSLLQAAFKERCVPTAQHSLSQEWIAAPPERRKHFHALTMMRQFRSLQAFESMEGLDYTHPFAHRPLVEFLLSVPPEVLCRAGEPRRLMRRALAELWPPRLRARRLKGLLGAPQFAALKPLAARLLVEPRWHVVDRGWVNKQELAVRLEKLQNGIDSNVPQLRQIILLEYWLRNREERRQTNLALKVG